MSQPGTWVLPPRGRTARSALALAAVAALGAMPAPAAEPPSPRLEYNRDIRPILSENCFRCHGPDSASRKAELRLDKRDVAVKAGALVPGKPEESGLVGRILSEDADEVMPPPGSHKALTPGQKDVLRRWVAEGSEYQPHWSLIAPARPEPPAVADATWARTPVDRFIQAKLQEHGLRPAPEADRRTLARRLSLDLAGLPPAPADVDAFVADSAPDYYETYVDKLLASPAHGEHRARYWLDAARYADTHGIHIDNYREAWAYRDWVIKALNANMPFDRFTVEQLAGDLIPNKTLDQQVASGFNRNNITTSEGGAIDEEYLVLYTRDRTETASQVFLGLTTGCAVCHDHKFDPISQKEFYGLAAFFNNTTQAAMDGNIKDTPPTVFVPEVADRDRWPSLAAEVDSLRGALEARKGSARPEFDAYFASAKPEAFAAMIPTKGQSLRARLEDRDAAPAASSALGSILELADAGDFDTAEAFSYGAWVKPAKGGLMGAVAARMDEAQAHRGWDLWLENGRVGTHIISKWEGDAVKVVAADAPLKPGEWSHVLVTYDGSAKASGVKIYVNGQLKKGRVDADSLKGPIKAAVPLKVGQRNASGKLDEVQVHDLRLYRRALPPAEAEALAEAGRAADLAAKPAASRPAAEVDAVFGWWLRTADAPTRELLAKLGPLKKEEAEVRARGVQALVMNEKADQAMAFILARGDYDKRLEPVKPGTPEALPPMPPELPRNRLGLAQWLLRPEHPLTARVTVNRFWQELFGTGLVKTSGDFGITGDLPSHPELLDWMAVEFREGGWDMKKFLRLLVTSAAYRQSAAAAPEALEKDPGNRLLSRGPRFRMDAEMVRDYALAASGLLVNKVGGPSVKPYQPDGVWEAVAMPNSDTHDYRRDSGEKLYRRSLYTFWKRSAPPASMEIFNAPNRETCAVRRERTDTPLQALVTLNDPQFVEAARALAQRVLREGEDQDTRIAAMARRLLARPARPEEAKVLGDSLADLLAYYRSHADDAAKLLGYGEAKTDPALDAAYLAAWTMLANEMFNLDEVLNK